VESAEPLTISVLVRIPEGIAPTSYRWLRPKQAVAGQRGFNFPGDACLLGRNPPTMPLLEVCLSAK